ncbi:MAG: hypothetical protein AMXMBFR75_16400 [Candidatus Hinthialibacteria bacterium]
MSLISSRFPQGDGSDRKSYTQIVIPSANAAIPNPNAVIPNPNAVIPNPTAVIPNPNAVIPNLIGNPLYGGSGSPLSRG